MSDTKEASRIPPTSEVRNAGLLLQWYGNRCQARCRHCSLRNTGRVCTVPFARAAAVADRFLAWRDQEMPPGFLVQFGIGYSDDFPRFAEYVAFCQQRQLPLPAYFVNGIAFRPEAEIADLLGAIKGLGLSSIQLTFYGLGKTHDGFAGRKGDFEFLTSFARLAGEAALGRYDSIALTKDNAAEVAPLVAVLEAIPGTVRRQLWLLDYRGRAKGLERVRMTAAALAALPESLRRLINMGPPRPIRTEAQWMARTRAEDIPAKTRRYLLLPTTEDNVAQLETADPGEFVQGAWEAEDRFRRALPSLPELARLFGRPRGTRLYAWRDLEWKWTDAYLGQHPELDAARAFDDRRISVMYH